MLSIPDERDFSKRRDIFKHARKYQNTKIFFLIQHLSYGSDLKTDRQGKKQNKIEKLFNQD
jgi:hypothetical protein